MVKKHRRVQRQALPEDVPTRVPGREKLYFRPEDVRSDYFTDIGFPGMPPYTRGSTASMYRSSLWEIIHYLRAAVPSHNAPLLKLLRKEGASAGIVPDVLTRSGIDPTEGAGRDGVSLFSSFDVRELKNNDEFRIDGGASLAQLSSMFLASGNSQIIPVFDPFTDELFREQVLKDELRMRSSIAALRYLLDRKICRRIAVSSYRIAEATEYPEMEMAYAVKLAEMLLSSLDWPAEPMQPLQVELSATEQLPNQVAKFRAFRRLWYRHFGDDYGEAVPHIVARGSMRELTEEQDENNAVRFTVQCLGAALGGAEGIALNEATAPVGIAGEKELKAVLRAHAIAAHEANIGDTVDPVAGSYYIEHMTDELETRAQRLLEMVKGMDARRSFHVFLPFIRSRMFEERRQLATREKIVVGVNMFRLGEKRTVSWERKRMKDYRDYIRKQRYQFLGQLPQPESNEYIETLMQLFNKGATVGQVTSLMAHSF